VSGDRYEVDVEAGRGASAMLSTQASTKVYRSTAPCSQSLRCKVADDALLALLPDPVVCFAGARYAQRIDVDLAPRASIAILDGYTCGRGARGERWSFARYESRVAVTRGDRPLFVDAVRLDPEHGALPARMSRFEAVVSLVAIGPAVAEVREAILGETRRPTRDATAVAAASPIGRDGAVLRVAGTSFEEASRVFRSCFASLTALLGDDPFARKW
jgi:urease accessory protein